MAARDPEAEAELRGELLALLDGRRLDEAWVSEALGGRFVLDRGSLEPQHAVPGTMGVLATGQSLSADLRVAAEGAPARLQQRHRESLLRVYRQMVGLTAQVTCTGQERPVFGALSYGMHDRVGLSVTHSGRMRA